MNSVIELDEVLRTEAELTESLAEVLSEQQRSIVHSRAGELRRLVERSEELIHPIQGLERERQRLARQLVAREAGSSPAGDNIAEAEELLDHLQCDDAALIGAGVRRLRAASRAVLRINRLNMPLLKHAQQFVKQTLRAATDDYRKNLVDKKM